MAIFGPSGGNGGHEYSDQEALNIQKQPMYIKTIKIWSGTLIDAIQLVYRVGIGELPGRKHGGDGGRELSINLGFLHLVGIYGTTANVTFNGLTGDFVESLGLILSDGTTYAFGGSASFNGQQQGYMYNTYRYQVDVQDEIIGFSGSSGFLVDSIGVITRHIVA